MKQQLNEFIKVADTAFALRLLRLMTMKPEKTGAYKAGLIDKEFKLIKKKEDFTPSDKKVYTLFHKLAFNLRKLIRKVPFVGKLTLSSYLAALWLIKDHTEMSEEDISKVLKEVTGINPKDIPLIENNLFINNEHRLVKGTYILNKNLLLPITGEELVLKGTEVIVKENCEPCGTIFETPVFKVYHPKTKHYIYVTQEELKDV
jgi:DNA-directed RNA polymerase subunit H (RpoH/RPB5)